MDDALMKPILARYLRRQHEGLRWKVEGLPERELRMPRTPTGTNLLGMLKHVSGVEADYLGSCLGRPFAEPLPWMDAEPDDDMFAAADESVEWVLSLHERVRAHAEATIEALPLDAPAHVPWWGEQADTTMGRLLVHLIAEVARHAGHADILREQIDAAAGQRPGIGDLAHRDPAGWAAYVERLRAIAEATPGE